MKKVIYIIVAVLVIVSCNKEGKNYVVFHGTIVSPNSDSLVIKGKDDYKKLIKVNNDGTFEDTLKVDDGYYQLFDGEEYASLYLKNGFELTMTLNTEEFDETLNFEGKGKEASNFMARSALFQENLFANDSLFTLDKEAYNDKIALYFEEFESDLGSTPNLDSVFVADQQNFVSGFRDFLNNEYDDRYYLNTVLIKGAHSPKFSDYENYHGGTTSLDDLKGKYVYIDLWATWCAPCKAEIPFLKKVEEAYHDKNIAFVSISLDREKDYDTWRNMVEEKELTGIQLYFKQNTEFVDAYKVKGIPRFILIDPEGNIVSSDAPRPSSQDLIDLFQSLNI